MELLGLEVVAIAKDVGLGAELVKRLLKGGYQL
jgi:hypothetical protein